MPPRSLGDQVSKLVQESSHFEDRSDNGFVNLSDPAENCTQN